MENNGTRNKKCDGEGEEGSGRFTAMDNKQ